MESGWNPDWHPVDVLSFTAIQHNYPNNPLASACRITSFFDAYRNSKPHRAQDVVKNGSATNHGDAVYAMESGTVTEVVSANGPASQPYPQCVTVPAAPANYVKIRTADGYDTIYAHVTPSVSVGPVNAGAQIGTLDNSGCQKAPHLHVGRKLSGNPVNFTIPCVNPTPTTNFDDGDVLDDISDDL